MSTETSRREFLRDAGAAAAAGAAVVLVLPGEADATRTAHVMGEVEKHRFVYLVDTTKCVGCGSCARACRAENDVPEGYARTWIERYDIAFEDEVYVDSPHGGELGFQPRVGGEEVKKAFFVPRMCNHCANTPCTQVCPVGASYRAPEGAVLVDPKHCIGCGYCVQACPYGSRYLHPVTRSADKCTWCYHRTTKGLDPACVAICPVGARQFGDREDPDDPINEALATRRVMVLQPELLTKPQCFYLGLDMEVR